MPKHTSSSPRRGIPKWLKVTIISLLVVANLALLGVIYFVWVGQRALSQATADEAVTGFLDEGSGGDLTILVVGSDSREGLDDLTFFGEAGGGTRRCRHVDQAGWRHRHHPDAEHPP